jgi:conjugative transposon TraN protein
MMNKLKRILPLMLLMLSGRAFSQHVQMFVIEPLPLEITLYKTTNLIFPYQLKSVDKGSRDILAQKAKGASNILQLKAARADFAQTNLTVVTAEGKLYSFIVDYAPEPLQLNIELADKGLNPDAFFEDGKNQAEIHRLAERISPESPMFKGVKDKSYQAEIHLNGLYIHDEIIFYQLEMQNKSQVSYELQSLRFFIRDRRRARRSAAQETEVRSLYVHGDTTAIDSKTARRLVFALPKFTLEDKKYLAIQVMEKNGGRHLQLDVYNRTIVRARPISE